MYDYSLIDCNDKSGHSKIQVARRQHKLECNLQNTTLMLGYHGVGCTIQEDSTLF